VLVSREAAEAIARDSARSGGEAYRAISRQVPALTVEEIVQRFSLDRIDLGKWDCEGGELGAFQHMRPETAQRFSALVGEYHMPAGSGFKEFRALAQAKFQHLRFYESPGHASIGPFWAVDNLPLEMLLRMQGLLRKGRARLKARKG
jgi:hypothetical protein